MAAIPATKKITRRKLYLQMSPHSVSIEFQPKAASLSASLPNLFLRVSRGSRATETYPAKLQEGLSGSTTYRASWNECFLPLNLALSQDETSGKFQSKEIKVQLKIASDGKSSHKSLASCTYDVTCLNLSALNYVGASSETRQLSLSTGKSAAATAAIRAITLEATFHYEFLRDDFDISVEQSRSRETSPHARSQPPVDTIRDTVLLHHSSTNNMQSTMLATCEQTAAHTELPEQKPCDSGETSNQHKMVIDDPKSPLTSKPRQRIQSTPVQSDRPPKPPRKKFQWFKKVSSGSKLNSANHDDASDAIQSSSSVVSSSELSTVSSPTEVASKVQYLSAHPTNTPTTQNEKAEKTQHNLVRDTIEIPPKPKLRLKASHSINSEPQCETLDHSEERPAKNGSSDSMKSHQCTQSDFQQDKPPIMHLNRPSPSDWSEESADDGTPSFSSPSLEANNGKRPTSNVHGHMEDITGTQKAVIAKHFRPHRDRQSSPAPLAVRKARGLSKHISGSTPHLSPAKLKHGKRSSSVSHLAATNRERSPKPSLSDLIKPTALASRSRSSDGCLNATSEQPDEQYLGILKVRLKALNTSDDFQSKTCDRQGDVKPPLTAKEGLCCTFTIGGGNGRFTSSVQPLVLRKTISWENNEEMLFYATPQSKKLFVLCRRIALEAAPVTSVGSATKTWPRDTDNGKCIGAAVLEISTVARCSSSPTDDVCNYVYRVECKDHTLPVQPKGTMLLQSCLYVMQPRFKLTCSGSVTIEALSGLHCNANHDLSCTVKIDSDFQDDTEPQQVDQCASSGWCNEPVNFKACRSFDCSVQIWAYSSEETEYWCGGCVVPLAMLLPDEEIRRHTTKEKEDDECVLSTHIDKTITLPVEPRGIIRLSFLLEPNALSHGHIPAEDKLKEDVHLLDQSASHKPRQPQQLPPNSMSLTKRGLLRRVTIRRAGNFNLTVLKSYSEEPFHPGEDSNQKNDLEEQMVDLKKEVEFLREELRQTKAKLAESEFYREQAQLELKSLQEKGAHIHANNLKSTKKDSKPMQRRR